LIRGIITSRNFPPDNVARVDAVSLNHSTERFAAFKEERGDRGVCTQCFFKKNVFSVSIVSEEVAGRTKKGCHFPPFICLQNGFFDLFSKNNAKSNHPQLWDT